MGDLRAVVASAIEEEAARLAADASSPHVAALLRYACRRAGEAADAALVMMMIEIPARDSARAEQTARRKAIYEELHPETRHGAVGRAGKSGQDVHSFADATAAATGKDARTVRRDAERGEKVSPEAASRRRSAKRLPFP